MWISLLALVIVGASDMVSVVIRASILQLATPPEMRGRVSAVNWLFVGASNEFGGFESGVDRAVVGRGAGGGGRRDRVAGGDRTGRRAVPRAAPGRCAFDESLMPSNMQQSIAEPGLNGGLRICPRAWLRRADRGDVERMTSGQKVAIGGSRGMLLAVGIELLWLHHERNRSGQAGSAGGVWPGRPDDLVFLKQERPSKLADLKDLYGTTVWVSAGGQMDYYPYAATTRTTRKPRARCWGPSRSSSRTRSSRWRRSRRLSAFREATKQVLLAFTMPKSADPEGVRGAGGIQAGPGDYTFYTDDLFFYDDPHELVQALGSAGLAGGRLAPGDPGDERAPGGAVARPGVQEREQRVRQPAGGVLRTWAIPWR
jgi:hypothetical protein